MLNLKKMKNERIIDELNQLKKYTVKTDNCKTCDSLKILIEVLHEILNKFTKDRENIVMILSSQGATYNNVCLGYDPKINVNSFNNICNANNSSNCNMLKYNYYNKIDHVALIFFLLKKIHEGNNACSPFRFYKEYHERKMGNVSASSHLSDHSSSWKPSDKMKFTNTKGFKIIWVPKVKVNFHL